ncbi:MAG: hypothetical protein ACLPWF_15100 [Bryobacteraceae bacterium]
MPPARVHAGSSGSDRWFLPSGEPLLANILLFDERLVLEALKGSQLLPAVTRG